jgi:surfactin synthase thioesterase subunit
MLPDSVEVVAVELPGRETRVTEPPPDDLTTLLDDLAIALAFGDDVPCAFFGHSWGAVLAFELSRRQHLAGRAPAQLIVSGARAPQLISPAPGISGLPRADLVAELARLGGMHPEILAHSEYLDVVLPAFRSDLRLAESYRLAPGPALPCPITAFGGDADPLISGTDLAGWRQHTAAEFRLEIFPGDHFFFVTARWDVVTTIREILAFDGNQHVPPAGQLNDSC